VELEALREADSMSATSLWSACKSRLRQWFPALSIASRPVRRAYVLIAADVVRKLVPAGIRWGPPKGIFSDYELLRQNRVSGRVVMTSQIVPVARADSLRKLSRLGQDGFQPWPVFWTRHQNARLVAKTLVLEDERRHISTEGAFRNHMTRLDPAWRYFRLPPPVRLAGNWTSVISGSSTLFYHWFLDALPRLAVLPEFPDDTKVLVHAELPAYKLDTLKWLGLEGRFRPTAERHLIIENYYFSSHASMTGGASPYSVAFLRRVFLNKADLSYDPPRKFYLRRVGKSRGIVNEAEVLDFFQNLGWAIVDTEAMPLAQQIRLFAQAERIVTLHGGGLTNLLWCQPGCQVLELCASTYLNGVYEGLAESLRLNYRFLICPADAAQRTVVSVDALKQALDF
jgi:capsular polysaccharide biosynthesis protein